MNIAIDRYAKRGMFQSVRRRSSALHAMLISPVELLLQCACVSCSVRHARSHLNNKSTPRKRSLATGLPGSSADLPSLRRVFIIVATSVVIVS